jgi:hypothetical protein
VNVANGQKVTDILLSKQSKEVKDCGEFKQPVKVLQDYVFLVPVVLFIFVFSWLIGGWKNSL